MSTTPKTMTAAGCARLARGALRMTRMSDEEIVSFGASKGYSVTDPAAMRSKARKDYRRLLDLADQLAALEEQITQAD